MEELRPVLADRLALTMLNRRQLRMEHFEELVRGEEQPACPDCAATNVKKQFSVFATHGSSTQPSFGGGGGGYRTRPLPLSVGPPRRSLREDVGVQRVLPESDDRVADKVRSFLSHTHVLIPFLVSKD